MVMVAAIIAIVVVSLKNKEGFGRGDNHCSYTNTAVGMNISCCDKTSPNDCLSNLEKQGCGPTINTIECYIARYG